MFTFTVFAEPTGKARPRVTTHGTYTPKKTKDYEKIVQWEYRKQGGRDYGVMMTYCGGCGYRMDGDSP